MAELFGREVSITVDNFRFKELDASFRIARSNQPEPNTCELTIFNLNPDHRAQLEAISPEGSKAAEKGIPCEIVAGYKGNTSRIWLGDLRTVETVFEGSDAYTQLTSGDGEKAWKHARNHVSFGPKTPVAAALRSIARALGVGEGNLSKVIAQLKVGGSAIWPTGKVLSGPASRQLASIAESADLEVSIQDGALQFLDRGEALKGTAILLEQGTGLIGSPSVDNEGIVSFSMQMIPDLKIGRQVRLNSRRVKGQYRVVQGEWIGDTSAGGAWQIDCRGEPL